MKQPCNNCPFRLDVDFGLPSSRRQDILKGLWHDSDFACHKTTVFDDDGVLINFPLTSRCIGAAIMLERYRQDGGIKANLMFRYALWTNEFTIDELDLKFPICSPKQFLE